MSAADNAPELAAVDAPEAHPAPAVPATPENAALGQQDPDAGDVEPIATPRHALSKADAQRLDSIRWTLIPRGWIVHPVGAYGFLATAWDTNRFFHTLDALGRWTARVEATQ